jgi:hypothetical protein
MQDQIVRTPEPGVTVIRNQSARASAEIGALRAERRELTSELDQLEATRYILTQQLRQLPTGEERQVLEGRLDDLLRRTSEINARLTSTNSNLARLGAEVREEVIAVPPRFASSRSRSDPPPQAVILGGVFMVTVLFPLSVAFAIRMLRRGKRQDSTLTAEFAGRLARMEQAIEASAIEIERIGEGQRYLTRVLSGSRAPEEVGQPFP